MINRLLNFLLALTLVFIACKVFAFDDTNVYLFKPSKYSSYFTVVSTSPFSIKLKIATGKYLNLEQLGCKDLKTTDNQPFRLTRISNSNYALATGTQSYTQNPLWWTFQYTGTATAITSFLTTQVTASRIYKATIGANNADGKTTGSLKLVIPSGVTDFYIPRYINMSTWTAK